MRQTSEFFTCFCTSTTSIPQQAHGEVSLICGLDDGVVGCGDGVGSLEHGVAGDACGVGGLGVGGVSSRRFRLPRVSLFLTTAGVGVDGLELGAAGEGCGGGGLENIILFSLKIRCSGWQR